MAELYVKLVAAIAPAVVLTVLILRRDKARPEPAGWLWGGCGARRCRRASRYSDRLGHAGVR